MDTEPSDVEATHWVAHVLLTRGILVLVLGVVAVAWPDITLKIAAVLTGILVLIFGLGIVGDGLHRRGLGWSWIPTLVAGVAVAGFGGALIIWPGPTVQVLAVLLGIALIASGFLTVLDLYSSRGNDPSYMASGLLGALSVLCGVVLVTWPDITLWALIVVQGIFWIVSGVLSIVASRKVDHLPTPA